MNYIEIGDERTKQNFTMMSLSAELLTNPKKCFVSSNHTLSSTDNEMMQH